MEFQKTKNRHKSGWGMFCLQVSCVCIYVCLPGSDSVAPWQRDKLIRMFSMSLNNVLSPHRVYVIN